MRIMGLDPGTRRIGVALSDPQGLIAFPSEVLQHSSEAGDLEAIASLVRKHQVERVVVGLPRSLDGSMGREAIRVQSFIEKLSSHLSLPVESWDERLSTVAAERRMSEAGRKREQRKAERDAQAAAFMLQGYLDRVRNLRQ